MGTARRSSGAGNAQIDDLRADLARALGQPVDGSTDQRNQQRATAAYVASLAGDLAAMARSNGMPTLAYLLEMATLEAEQAARAV